MNPWVLLGFAIVGEVIATLSLRASEGFTKPVFSVLVVLGYGAAFWIMSRVTGQLPIGVIYAVWSGVGTALVTLLGAVLFREPLTVARLAGVGLIVGGVVVLNTLGGAAH